MSKRLKVSLQKKMEMWKFIYFEYAFELSVIIILIYFAIILSSCSSESSKNQDIQQWQLSEYKICSLNIINSPAFDFVVTTHRFDLPYGRYDALNSMRPMLAFKNRSELDVGTSLINKFGQENVQASQWVENKVFLTKRWQDPQHAMYEEYIGDIILDSNYHAAESYEYDLINNNHVNLTESFKVSYYSTNISKFTNNLLSFFAVIEGNTRIFTMNPDGSDKKLMSGSSANSYGFNISPDGTKYAYHADYKIIIGETISKIEKPINNPCPSNFMPKWSPDSKHIVFACGIPNQIPMWNDLYVADATTGQVTYLASRDGFDNQVPFTNQRDFHGGGSDNYVWSKLGVIYAAGVNPTELYLNNERLTYSKNDGMNNFPTLSPDGKTLFYTKKQGTKRDVYSMDLNTKEEIQITNVDENCGTRYPMVRLED